MRPRNQCCVSSYCGKHGFLFGDACYPWRLYQDKHTQTIVERCFTGWIMYNWKLETLGKHAKHHVIPGHIRTILTTVVRVVRIKDSYRYWLPCSTRGTPFHALVENIYHFAVKKCLLSPQDYAYQSKAHIASLNKRAIFGAKGDLSPISWHWLTALLYKTKQIHKVTMHIIITNRTK